MNVRLAQPSDADLLIELIGQFRITLSRFRGPAQPLDLNAAAEELDCYGAPNYQVRVAEADDGALAGYLVCRIEDDVVWVESLFVLPVYRRQGIGTALYQEAEQLAESLGRDTVYNWIHPNNDRMIAFLQKRHYTVLNMIELRRARAGEMPAGRINVGSHSFDY